jgi:hypothetical protein
MDLRMLAYVQGRERSLDSLTQLALDAGLVVSEVMSAGPRRGIVEFLPDVTQPHLARGQSPQGESVQL